MSIRMSVLLVALVASTCYSETILMGSPTISIWEDGDSRQVLLLTADESSEKLCVITFDGTRYIWESRGKVELIPIESGVFITYLAVNGSGYIRTIKPGFESAFRQDDGMPPKYDYVEHLLTFLAFITYYGTKT